MSDEPTSNRPADMTSTDTDTDGGEKENPSPQVFDITPDLDIAPAKDDVESAVPPTIPDNILGVEMRQTSVEPKVEEKVVPTQPEFGPANPPAKTVGVISLATKELQVEQNTPKPEPSSLQEAVSTIKFGAEVPKITNPVNRPVAEKPWQARADSVIKPLRTYETDFAEAMAKKRISKASFVIAEDKRKIKQREVEVKDVLAPVPASTIASNATILTPKPQEVPKKEDYIRNARPLEDEEIRPQNPHTTRNWILSIVSLILICGGAFAGYYLYLRSPIAPVNTQTQNQVNSAQQFENSIINADQRSILNIDNKNQSGIISSIKSESSKPQDQKTIREIVLTKTYATGVGKVPANEMLNLAEIPAPDLFGRSLSSTWMLGVYAGQNDIKHPFIITTNNFFQNTFAGLIQWEKTMSEDLKVYISSSDFDEGGSNSGIRGQFKDRIIRNKDVREYVAENGHIIFLYSFISNDKLVITNSEEALEEIITRLEKSAFVR